MRMIVEMEVTNFIVKASSAKMARSNVTQVTVLPLTSVAMAIEIAVICQMKSDVHQNIQVEDIVQKLDSNAITTFAFSTLMFVMALMIAEVKNNKFKRFNN